ncbi:hypothetical protein BDV11DRAFT_118364 [Aspergillus similis]
MRLYGTPEGAVEAGANNPRPDVAPEDHLGDNRAQCRHDRRFRRVEGGRRPLICERCDAEHYVFLLQCRMCPLTVCQQCRQDLRREWCNET